MFAIIYLSAWVRVSKVGLFNLLQFMNDPDNHKFLLTASVTAILAFIMTFQLAPSKTLCRRDYLELAFAVIGTVVVAGMVGLVLMALHLTAGMSGH